MLVYAHTRQNLDTLLSVSLSHTEKHTVCVRIIPLSLLCTFHETRTHTHTHTHTLYTHTQSEAGTAACAGELSEGTHTHTLYTHKLCNIR